MATGSGMARSGARCEGWAIARFRRQGLFGPAVQKRRSATGAASSSSVFVPHKVKLGALERSSAKVMSNQWLGDQIPCRGRGGGQAARLRRHGACRRPGFGRRSAKPSLTTSDAERYSLCSISESGRALGARDWRPPHEARHPDRRRRRHLRHQVDRLHPRPACNSIGAFSLPNLYTSCRWRGRRTGYGAHLDRYGGDVAGPRLPRPRSREAEQRRSRSRARATAHG